MGKDSFKGYKVPPTPDELTIFHGGDTGISFGETVAEYRLLGKSYELKSRWTATLVKQDGKWLLAAYHISMNVLDNPILSAAKSGIYLGVVVALVIGILIGRILGSAGPPNRPPPAPRFPRANPPPTSAVGKIPGKNRLFVELHDDRLVAEADAFQQGGHRQRRFDLMRVSVQLDFHQRHCESCSGKGSPCSR